MNMAIAKLQGYENCMRTSHNYVRHASATDRWQRYISDQNTVTKYRPLSSTSLKLYEVRLQLIHVTSFAIAQEESSTPEP